MARFKTRFKDFEFEYEANEETEVSLSNFRKLVSEFLKTMAEGAGQPAVAQERLAGKGAAAEYPSIPKPEGPSDAILKFLSTDWGRAKPRTSSEIIEALKNNAIYYSEGSITGSLTNMVKGGRLRRVKLDGLFGYLTP